MRELRYVVADVFTDTPLTGNQLAVFTDGREVDDATMQALAKEMNVSETVFVLPSESAHARIRVFTPTAELLFAGHPTHGSVALRSPEEVAALRPNTQVLSEFPVGVNCFAPLDAHWKTRVFVPFIGIPEDPATGSAAGPFAVHLLRHGRIRSGDQVEIEQGAELGRPSRVFARAEGTPDTIERVEVGGSAVVVARGEFRLP